MSYAKKAAAEPSLVKERMAHSLAHFSHTVTPQTLIFAVQKGAKVIPFGVKKHPRGAILTFFNADERDQALSAEILLGKTKLSLTKWPLLSTHPAQRGKRWRASNVPFTATTATFAKALIDAGIPPKEVKLETVPNFPSVRTEFASFWIEDPAVLPPKSITVDGEKVNIFNPEKPKKTAPQGQMDPQAKTVRPQPQPQPQPQPLKKEPQPTRRSLRIKDKKASGPPVPPSQQPSPSTPLPPSEATAPATDKEPRTPSSQGEKKRKATSPLSHQTKPTLGKSQPPLLNEDFFEEIGLKVPKEDSVLIIYERVSSRSECKIQSDLLPTKLKADVTREEASMEREEGLSDWFFLQTPTQPKSQAPQNLFKTLFSTFPQAAEQGIIQVINGEASTLIIFKTRLLIWQKLIRDS